MPGTVPDPTWIYHMTHVSNLEAIIAADGLRSVTSLRDAAAAPTSIAYESIQGRRATTRVPCGQGGCLHDYVPFYFTRRSPMLFTIHKGNVACEGGQEAIVHLVSNVKAVVDAGLPFVFTDGHGIMRLTEFFDDLSDLHKVDWGVVEARYWHDTNEDGDRRRRKQAEFLVHGSFPWSLVAGVAVATPQMATRVESLIQQATHRPKVASLPAYYYN